MKTIVRISQGLANRMFQVAFAYSLVHDGADVELDNIETAKFKHEDVKIHKIFPKIDLKQADYKIIKKLKGKDTFINKILRRIPVYSNVVICPYNKPFSKNYYRKYNNKYYIGTFQSEKYFENIKDTIRNIFKFPEIIGEKNIEIISKMKSSESVSIHVRKGYDYEKKIYKNTCTLEYYESAISYMKENLNNPTFFVFTDNVEWVTENFKGLKYCLIDWNPKSGPLNYIDMQLMSCAKHNIIANSTYSWWGAWLNNNKNKIIIAPKFWYNPQIRKLHHLDIIPKNWITF